MKKIILLAAVTLAMTACDKNDDNVVPASGAAKITATIGESTLSRASDAEWGEGDEIGISSIVGDKAGPYINVKYTTGGDGDFTGETTIYFYKLMTLTAYYPFTAFTGEEGEAPGIITADTDAGNQSEEKQPKIDFLYAGATYIDTSGNVPEVKFTFSHKMSKITLIFENGNLDEKGDRIVTGADVSKITSYTIDGLRLDGTFDTETGECAANSDVAAAPLSITMSEGTVKNKVTLPSLIVFPQSPADKVRLKLHDSENQDYVCDLNFGDKGLESGKNYQFTIKVSKTGLNVDPSITDWSLVEIKENHTAESDDSDDTTENTENPENPEVSED